MWSKGFFCRGKEKIGDNYFTMHIVKYDSCWCYVFVGVKHKFGGSCPSPHGCVPVGIFFIKGLSLILNFNGVKG